MRHTIEPMKVDLIEITPPRKVVEVWVNSRPDILSITHDEKVYDNAADKYYTFDEYLNILVKMNLSNVYFTNITCNVTSSLLVRDYFYQFSNYIAQWAKTNRNGIDKFHLVASEEAYNSKDDDCYEEMYNLLTKFESRELQNFDAVKEHLPYSFQTTWQFSMPVKLLMRILGYTYHSFGHNKFTNCIWKAFADIEELKPYLGLIGRYTDYDDPLFPYYEAQESATVGNTVIDKREIGVTVFSHLIRHEGVQIGGFTKLVKDFISNKTERTCDKLTFDCSITLPKQRLLEIIKLRTSWFAMTDDWNNKNTWAVYLHNFISGDLDKDKPYLKYFDFEGNFIPSEVHAYASETSIRVRKDNRSQLPDAFILESREIVEERIRRVGMNPLLNDYLQMFDRGYVKDNPENTARKKWEEIK